MLTDDAKAAYVAVETASGPHVTPQAFAVAGGHVWLVAARGSLKVRSLGRRPELGLLFRDGDESLAVSGTADVLSPFSPADAARLAARAPYLSCAAGDYAARNAALLAGYAADFASARAGLPVDRVLIKVTPDRTTRLTGVLRGVTVDVGALPVDTPAPAHDLLASSASAVLGLSTADGPVAVPARWDGATGRAHASPQDLAAVGAFLPARACLSIDRSDGVRPSRFAGVLLRGVLVPRPGGQAHLTVERATWWRGFAAHTVRTA